jgi:hypothetical protein
MRAETVCATSRAVMVALVEVFIRAYATGLVMYTRRQYPIPLAML